MSWRLEESIQAMAEFCPNLAYQPLPPSAGGGGQWAGVIQPIVSAENLAQLLDDIHHNQPVYGAPRGELRHLPDCKVEHCDHGWMQRTGDLRAPFTIAIHYLGGRAHPRCWVVSPHIPKERGRHIWDDGSICPFLASDDAWVYDRDTVADFVPHISVWLVTWLVFQRTGVWIVGEHEGTPEHHLEIIHPTDQCWCRSGRKYRKCHLRADEQLASLRRLRGVYVGQERR